MSDTTAVESRPATRSGSALASSALIRPPDCAANRAHGLPSSHRAQPPAPPAPGAARPVEHHPQDGQRRRQTPSSQTSRSRDPEGARRGRQQARQLRPMASPAMVTARNAVWCQRYSVIADRLTVATAAQASGRRIHRASGSRSSSARPHSGDAEGHRGQGGRVQVRDVPRRSTADHARRVPGPADERAPWRRHRSTSMSAGIRPPRNAPLCPRDAEQVRDQPAYRNDVDPAEPGVTAAEAEPHQVDGGDHGGGKAAAHAPNRRTSAHGQSGSAPSARRTRPGTTADRAPAGAGCLPVAHGTPPTPSPIPSGTHHGRQHRHRAGQPRQPRAQPGPVVPGVAAGGGVAADEEEDGERLEDPRQRGEGAAATPAGSRRAPRHPPGRGSAPAR